ncbi:unnamed protein product [Linum trigynum]|uniref:Uncharacterized protein n=1 Tax=Linum trigynum TaxID=586398 RepID=A0AAV2F842_9ROSI
MGEKLQITVLRRKIAIRKGGREEKAAIVAFSLKIVTAIFRVMGANLERQPTKDKKRVSPVESRPLSCEPARNIAAATSRIATEMSGRDPPSSQRIKVLT